MRIKTERKTFILIVSDFSIPEAATVTPISSGSVFLLVTAANAENLKTILADRDKSKASMADSRT